MKKGTPKCSWKTIERSSGTITEHSSKINLYKWMQDSGLTMRDVIILVDEGYGNGWEVAILPRRYYQMGL